MGEENKQNMEEPAIDETPKDEEQTTETPDTNELITNMFTELMAEMKTINQTLNNLNPVSEEQPEEEVKPEEEETEDQPDTLNGTTEPTPEEIAEADRILQED